MPFAAGLQESLQNRGAEVPSELTRGDSLESVLNRHLLAVEENFEGHLITSILLLLVFLDNPFHEGVGGLRPVAMERTLEIIRQRSTLADQGNALPCDAEGNPL